MICIRNYSKYIVYVLAVLCLIMLVVFNYVIYPVKYKKEISYYSNLYGLDSTLVVSVVKVESSFNQNAISNKGAKGLMQLMPTTAQWLCEKMNEDYSEEKLFIPEFNIKVGTYYLKYLLDKFDNVDNAILAYNAGEGTLAKWLNDENVSTNGNVDNVPYKETSNYLIKVKRTMKMYKDRI